MKHEFWERTIKEFSLDRDLADFKTWDVVRQIPIYTAHTIFDRGYRGAYFIVDFPEIARISSYYLGGRAEVLHSVDDIPDYLPLNLLFIATWSLSEAPLELRNKIAEKLSGADCLILF